MWAYIAFVALGVLIFAVPMVILATMQEIQRWKLESAVYKATACRPWIGRDNR